MNYETRNVVLEKPDIETVQQVADRRGLGARGFSAALRMIIREWIGYQARFRITDQGRAALEAEREQEEVRTG